MTPSEIGCSLSHISVWTPRRSQAVAIFEDDVILAHEFSEKLAEFMRRVPEPWDILYLGYIDTGGLQPTDIPGVKRVTFVFGAYAYVLSQPGLDKVRSHLPVDRPLDNFLGKLTERGALTGYAPTRPLARQIQFGGPRSDISHSAHSPPN